MYGPAPICRLSNCQSEHVTAPCIRLGSALLLLALGVVPASAARWLPVSEGQARAVYIDLAGISREGEMVRTWVREVHTQEQRSDQVGVYFYSANSLVDYDCQRRTWAPLFRVFYGADGTELRRVNLDAAELPALASPGSLQEGLLERACAPPAKAAKPKAKPVALAQAETAAQPTAVSAGKEAAAEASAAKPADPPTQPRNESPGPQPAKAAGTEEPAKAAPRAQPASTAASQHTVAGPPRGREVAVRAAAYEPRRRSRRAVPKTLAETAQAPHPEVHWSYSGEGAPPAWGKLKPEYETCAKGQRQSPIDIRDGARLELQPIAFDYKPSPLRIIDNGHTVQVNYAEGSSITVAGERFELKQFHFHKPAEERIDGRAFDMVAHLVHRSLDGRLAVVAVLLEAREQAHPFLRALWPHLPLEPGREVLAKDVTIDVNALLPEVRSYFTYIGSLTTPPCSEGVLWLVLKTPVEVAPEQVAVFGKLYSMNARPLQPTHGRLIKESM
jgi:carbonic anhydrase